MKILYITLGCSIALLLGLFTQVAYNECKPIEVKLLQINYANTNESAWTRVPTHAIYEVTATKERITGRVLGKEGDTFTTRKRDL